MNWDLCGSEGGQSDYRAACGTGQIAEDEAKEDICQKQVNSEEPRSSP